jgi:hypothetical protein
MMHAYLLDDAQPTDTLSDARSDLQVRRPMATAAAITQLRPLGRFDV